MKYYIKYFLFFVYIIICFNSYATDIIYFNPYVDMFENYTNSTPLINGTNKWYASNTGCKIQTNICNSGTKAVIIPMDTTLSNKTTAALGQNIKIKFHILPSFYDSTNYPTIETNSSLQFFINSNGYFVVCNKTNWIIVTNFVNGTSAKNIVTQTNSGSFVKIQVYLQYLTHTWKLKAWTNNVYVSDTDFLNFTSNFPSFNGFSVYQGSSTSYIDDVTINIFPVGKYNGLSPEVIQNINGKSF